MAKEKDFLQNGGVAEVEKPAEERVEDKAPVTAEANGGGPADKPAKPKRPPMPPKKKKKIIKWSIVGAVLLLVVVILIKVLGGNNQNATEVVTDVVSYGAITASVEGSGLTKAKNSETITLTTVGTVQTVYVTEGQKVTAGTPLFVVDSEAARTAVETARKDVEGYEKQLRELNKDIAGLNFTPPYEGKLMETTQLEPGDTINKGDKLGMLVDDTVMTLRQYYSYAYQNDIRTGQTANISIPALMSSIEGTVTAVHMVERISPEGSKLFAAEFSINNPGSLTADMVASAVLSAGGEQIYPYESGKLEYRRSTDLNSTVSGTIIASRLLDYMDVTPGMVLLEIDGDNSENEIFSVEQSLTDAQKKLDAAQENLDNCEAVAPIDGTVVGLTLSEGSEITANTAVVTISDLTTIIVDGTVDERNISYIKAGMPVDISDWNGNMFTGMVETVSMSSKAEGGVAAYPITISVDNSEGTLFNGSYVNYNLVASQNDNCLILPLQSVRTVALEDGTPATVVYVSGSKPENALENVMASEDIPDGFWPVPVEIGISDNYSVEIKSGVEEGTEVFSQILTSQAWG